MYENLTGVDEEGLAGLTMRRLAGEVGTTPMALYHHVSDKDALLVLMLEDLARKFGGLASQRIGYYSVGEITIHRSAARRDDVRSAPNLRDQIFAHLDPEQYPHPAALGPRWAELTARDTYRAGLEALVNGFLFPTAPG